MVAPKGRNASGARLLDLVALARGHRLDVEMGGWQHWQRALAPRLHANAHDVCRGAERGSGRSRRSEHGVFHAFPTLVRRAPDANVEVVVVRRLRRLHHEIRRALTQLARNAVLFGIAQEPRADVPSDENVCL